MTIQFDTIPASLRKPGTYIEFNTALAVRTLPANAQRVCLIVPLLTAGAAIGTAAPLTPIQVNDADAAGVLFGGTIAAKMVQAAVTANRFLDLSCIGIGVADEVTEPDITAALDAIAAAGFDVLVSAWQSQVALTALRTHIASVTDAVNQQAVLGVAASTDTLAATTTLATALNAGAITLALLPGSTSSAAEIAAAYAAVIASEQDPARPLNTLPLTGIAPPPLASRLTRTEQETCLANGVSPLEVGPGEVVQIVRAISTYTKNAAGSADIALLDLTTMRTLYYVRRACRDRIVQRFPRSKLSGATPEKVRSELLDVLKKLEELEIVENVDANAAALVVERSTQDPSRLNASIPTDVVNGLHVFAARVDLLL
ncbi:tail sheath protein [Mizugakiibacter sediminis]|uniref:Tail sheath protein n=1 Tax=Mizugakiibacter sediminis TaxID=1475481 RepID=A0A0K8QMY8_9GAMM|nr:phage tail sheath subtilisin-like domain-containing protein [Mizugakiibacter sediminis]GAP66265.1 tail sheath protein [Mizugakiibacter sediminis]